MRKWLSRLEKSSVEKIEGQKSEQTAANHRSDYRGPS
jgi:hypothetical protein